MSEIMKIIDEGETHFFPIFQTKLLCATFAPVFNEDWTWLWFRRVKLLTPSFWHLGVYSLLLKRRLWNRRFLVNVANFLRTNILQNTSGGLLLKYISKMGSILWRLWDVSKMSLTNICDFSKITYKNAFMGLL